MKKTLIYLFIGLLLASYVAAEVEVDRIVAVSASRDTKITGKVIDSQTGQGLGDLPIEIWCNGVNVVNKTSKTQGSDLGKFDYTTVNPNCDPGKEVYAIAWHKGVRYASEKVLAFETDISYDKAIIPPIGVPEFSPLTATLAIAICGIGLAAIRRKA